LNDRSLESNRFPEDLEEEDKDNNFFDKEDLDNSSDNKDLHFSDSDNKESKDNNNLDKD